MTPRRFAWLWIFGMVALLVGAVILGSCSHPKAIEKPAAVARPVFYQKSVAEQHALALQLSTTCEFPGEKEKHFYGGSGVLISRNELLTAFHVVSCVDDHDPKNIKVGRLLGVNAKLEGSEWKNVTVEAIILGPDIARLRTSDESFFRSAPVMQVVAHVGEPFIDDVCLEPGFPKRERQCGFIQELTGDRDSGNLRHGAETHPGNSGSGLYDEQGHLVGIVTHYRSMMGIVYFGGSATTLWERRWVAQGDEF